MEDPLYREIILEHFKSPLNYGAIVNPDFQISDSNPLCGDEVKITGKIKRGKLADVKFLSLGCAISKAASSIMTGQFLGKETSDILKTTPEEFLEAVGINLSPSRVKCALLGYSALKKALVRF